ncbi:unnamed protein product, partial [Lymnaea stagnalis]
GYNRVNLTFEPFQIISVNELSQAVALSSLITFEWFLLGCQWNTSEYNDIATVDVDTSIMWTPVITNPKSMDQTQVTMTNTASVTADGKVTVRSPSRVITACHLNLEKYPFDAHHCTIPFLSVAKIDVYPQVVEPQSYLLETYFSTSAEWRLLEHSCTAKEAESMNIVYTECTIYMERRSAFYVATLVFPIGLMSFMTLLVFCIPPDSGEKMSFVISIFVSMTVFINFVVDVIPRSMDRFPRILQLIVAVIIKIAVTTAATAYVLQKHRREKRKDFEHECRACKDSRVPTPEKPLEGEFETPKKKFMEDVDGIESVILEKGNGHHHGVSTGQMWNKVDSEVSSTRVKHTGFTNGDAKATRPGWFC